MDTPQIHCPKCNSTQIHADKKGFSGGKAVVGGLLTGGIGLLAGTIGSNKLKLTCMNCGKVFKPGAKPDKPKFVPTAKSRRANTIILLVTLGIIILIIILCNL